MNQMEVKLTIDLDNERQTEAMKNFLDAMTKGSTPSKQAPVRNLPGKATKSVEDEEDFEDEEDEEERKKAAARERARKSREAKKAAEAKKAQTEEDDDFEDDFEDDEEEIDLATLRKLTADKVKESTDNRDAIKAQLAKLKVKNVSSLKESQFASYYKFITAL
jgi:hypothetical protein